MTQTVFIKFLIKEFKKNEGTRWEITVANAGLGVEFETFRTTIVVGRAAKIGDWTIRCCVSGAFRAEVTSGLIGTDLQKEIAGVDAKGAFVNVDTGPLVIR